MADCDSREEAEQFCRSDLKEKMVDSSPLKAPIVMSEKIDVLSVSPGTVIECMIVGYVFGDGDTDT